jgi:hypothetical protein
MSELCRTRIKRNSPPDLTYGRASVWLSHCTCGDRHFTDDGWADAMVWALAHRSPDYDGEARCQRPHVGWWPWTPGAGRGGRRVR